MALRRDEAGDTRLPGGPRPRRVQIGEPASTGTSVAEVKPVEVDWGQVFDNFGPEGVTALLEQLGVSTPAEVAGSIFSRYPPGYLPHASSGHSRDL